MSGAVLSRSERIARLNDLARREIEILFGDRCEVQRLVDGLQQDIARLPLQRRAGSGRHAIVSDHPKRKFRQIPT